MKKFALAIIPIIAAGLLMLELGNLWWIVPAVLVGAVLLASGAG